MSKYLEDVIHEEDGHITVDACEVIFNPDLVSHALQTILDFAEEEYFKQSDETFRLNFFEIGMVLKCLADYDVYLLEEENSTVIPSCLH